MPADLDDTLWWMMVSTGVAAAGLSIIAAFCDRRGSDWPSRRARFILHLISYVLMSVSVLMFAARGLLGTS
jgi:hypothetical protein